MSDATTFPTGIAASDTPYLRAATGSSAVGPVQPRERMQLLDVLRHHRIVRGNHQHGDVDARGAGYHGANEPLVPRHVHHAEPGVQSHRGGPCPGRHIILAVVRR